MRDLSTFPAIKSTKTGLDVEQFNSIKDSILYINYICQMSPNDINYHKKPKLSWMLNDFKDEYMTI